MKNKVLAGLFAFMISTSMIAGNAGFALASQEDVTEAEESGETGGVSLSLAEHDEDTQADDAQEQEETETETETEEKVEYETLETTVTGEGKIDAIDVSEIVENTMPSIVAITTSSIQEVESFYFYGGSQEIEVEGGGSGFIIAQNDTELLIATNNHVVQDAKELTVCFSVEAEDPETLVAPAVVKGTSGKQDLAVIAVKLADINKDVLKQLKIATLGSSADLKVGQTSIVIGNALGEGQTVTTGIISALEREIATEVGTFTEFQTDAAINFGCSGGAILNGRGEVIGITSAKATSDYAESMGYGIPIDTAVPVLQDLINRETRDAVENHGYIGITVVPVSEEAREMYNMPAGAFVYEVTEGSAGDQAGIKKGNIITKFDGREIGSSDELVKTLGYYEAGETVTVEIQVAEGGEYVAKEVEVTLQKGAADDEQETEAGDEEKAEENQADPDSEKYDGFVPDEEMDPYAQPEDDGLYDFFFGGNDPSEDRGFNDFFFGRGF